ncbi:hypothetical protein EVG20_g10934 [Dentipellis fragilis]|uniref:Uncharacterized protein n=1 Tax=Dentipellis fragilis TaxID=205917 RepID=A0A4Y9XQE5_9AGAM|nr:hypothetical protein EVG20_g10934 [Dentipellis fragilis]
MSAARPSSRNSRVGARDATRLAAAVSTCCPLPSALCPLRSARALSRNCNLCFEVRSSKSSEADTEQLLLGCSQPQPQPQSELHLRRRRWRASGCKRVGQDSVRWVRMCMFGLDWIDQRLMDVAARRHFALERCGCRCLWMRERDVPYLCLYLLAKSVGVWGVWMGRGTGMGGDDGYEGDDSRRGGCRARAHCAEMCRGKEACGLYTERTRVRTIEAGEGSAAALEVAPLDAALGFRGREGDVVRTSGMRVGQGAVSETTTPRSAWRVRVRGCDYGSVSGDPDTAKAKAACDRQQRVPTAIALGVHAKGSEGGHTHKRGKDDVVRARGARQAGWVQTAAAAAGVDRSSVGIGAGSANLDAGVFAAC